MADRNLITAEDVRKLLDYDPETGLFVWRRRSLRLGFERIDKGWNTRYENKLVAIRLDKRGYRQICIAPFSNMFAHRIAWLHVFGSWPADEIDHINGDPLDNRISNMRVVNRQQNMINQKLRKDNTSGVKGVSLHKKSNMWHVHINVDKKIKVLGTFRTIEEAASVRKQAEIKYHGEYARKI